MKGDVRHSRFASPSSYDPAVLTPAYLGSLLRQDLVAVDVGARWGAATRWRPFGPRVKVIGFDPDEEECARLAAIEPDVTYVPLALGAKAGQATLYRTVEPACSSLYPPVEDLTTSRPALRVMHSRWRRSAAHYDT